MELKTCSKFKVKLIGRCLYATRKIKFIYNIFSKWLAKIISKEVDTQIDIQLPDWVKLCKNPTDGKEAVERWRSERKLFDKRPCNAFDCDRWEDPSQYEICKKCIDTKYTFKTKSL